MDTAKTRPYIILAIGVLAVSFSAILVRLTPAPPAATAFWRMLFSCLMLLPLAVAQRKSFAVSRRDVVLCGIAGVFLALHFLSWFTSLGMTSVSSSTLLVNIHPLVVVTAAWLLFGEKFPAAALAGGGIALAGTIILAWADLQLEGQALTGDLLAVVGGIMVAGYFLIGRQVRKRVPLIFYALLVYSFSSLVLLVWNLATATPLHGYSPWDWLVFAALALVSTIFGHTLLNWALRHLATGAVSLSVLGEPVLASLLAIPLLQEMPGPLQAVGGVLVLVGIWLFMKNSNAGK